MNNPFVTALGKAIADVIIRELERRGPELRRITSPTGRPPDPEGRPMRVLRFIEAHPSQLWSAAGLAMHPSAAELGITREQAAVILGRLYRTGRIDRVVAGIYQARRAAA